MLSDERREELMNNIMNNVESFGHHHITNTTENVLRYTPTGSVFLAHLAHRRGRKLMLSIFSYVDRESANAQIKAMCVKIGNYKVYFSYHTLIGFYDHNTRIYYITKKEHSYTTSRHKWNIGGYEARKKWVSQKLLELIVATTMGGLEYSEAENKIGIKDLYKEV